MTLRRFNVGQTVGIGLAALLWGIGGGMKVERYFQQQPTQRIELTETQRAATPRDCPRYFPIPGKYAFILESIPDENSLRLLYEKRIRAFGLIYNIQGQPFCMDSTHLLRENDTRRGYIIPLEVDIENKSKTPSFSSS